MNKKVTIAVIDSGLTPDLLTDMIKIKKNYIVCKDTIVENSDVFDNNGHGTSCVYTIWKLCPSCDFVIIKVLNANNNSFPELIINALEYLTTIDVDILNLSLSLYSDSYDQYIKEIIEKLIRQNKIIITSADNNKLKVNRLSLFDHVISIEGAPFITREKYGYNILKNQGISSNIPIITPMSKDYRIFSGNSKATANFTGILGNFLVNNPDREFILQQLYEATSLKTWTLTEVRNVYKDLKSHMVSTINPKKYTKTHHMIYQIIRKYIAANNENEVKNKSLFDIGINKNNCISVLHALTRHLSQVVPLDSFNYLDLSTIYTLHDALLPYLNYQGK